MRCAPGGFAQFHIREFIYDNGVATREFDLDQNQSRKSRRIRRLSRLEQAFRFVCGSKVIFQFFKTDGKISL
jgi:hypothetical protein